MSTIAALISVCGAITNAALSVLNLLARMSACLTFSTSNLLPGLLELDQLNRLTFHSLTSTSWPAGCPPEEG